MSDDMIKQKYIEFVKRVQETGHNLVEEPILFTWSWPEAPDIEFQLLIRGIDENEEADSEQVSITEQDEEDESYSIQINKPTLH